MFLLEDQPFEVESDIAQFLIFAAFDAEELGKHFCGEHFLDQRHRFLRLAVLTDYDHEFQSHKQRLLREKLLSESYIFVLCNLRLSGCLSLGQL